MTTTRKPQTRPAAGRRAKGGPKTATPAAPSAEKAAVVKVEALPEAARAATTDTPYAHPVPVATGAPALASLSGRAAAGCYGDIAALNRAGIEAALQSTGLLVKAMGDFNSELASCARSTAEAQFAGVKALAASTSLSEMLEAQADLARVSAEQLVTQATRVGILAVAAAVASGQPLAEHWALAYRSLVRPRSA